jgi:hypothetical protein
MREGFLMTPYMAGIFFRVCRRYKIQDYTDRMSLVRLLVARKKAVYIRDMDPYLEGKNVLKIRPKKEPS